MAKKGKGGFMSSSAYNQSNNREDSPDGEAYFHWDDVLAHHGSTQDADMEGTVNSRSGQGIMGHGNPGEPHAGGHHKK